MSLKQLATFAIAASHIVEVDSSKVCKIYIYDVGAAGASGSDILQTFKSALTEECEDILVSDLATAGGTNPKLAHWSAVGTASLPITGAAVEWKFKYAGSSVTKQLPKEGAKTPQDCSLGATDNLFLVGADPTAGSRVDAAAGFAQEADTSTEEFPVSVASATGTDFKIQFILTSNWAGVSADVPCPTKDLDLFAVGVCDNGKQQGVVGTAREKETGSMVTQNAQVKLFGVDGTTATDYPVTAGQPVTWNCQAADKTCKYLMVHGKPSPKQGAVFYPENPDVANASGVNTGTDEWRQCKDGRQQINVQAEGQCVYTEPILYDAKCAGSKQTGRLYLADKNGATNCEPSHKIESPCATQQHCFGKTEIGACTSDVVKVTYTKTEEALDFAKLPCYQPGGINTHSLNCVEADRKTDSAVPSPSLKLVWHVAAEPGVECGNEAFLKVLGSLDSITRGVATEIYKAAESKSTVGSDFSFAHVKCEGENLPGFSILGINWCITFTPGKFNGHTLQFNDEHELECPPPRRQLSEKTDTKVEYSPTIKVVGSSKAKTQLEALEKEIKKWHDDPTKNTGLQGNSAFEVKKPKPPAADGGAAAPILSAALVSLVLMF